MMEHTLVLFLDEGIHVTGRDLAQELDVLVRVELGHFSLGGWLGALYALFKRDIPWRTTTGHTKISIRLYKP